ncbi:MAG: Gfo/Idh/MocA family oxidoreductase [Clostridiales bacterium]|nr:Gfo/Idh/MocA family oxidoreductase [Clostridiales bacterium]
MKIVQIGGAGHAFYAYNAIKSHAFDFAALSCGSHGIEAEGTNATLADLQRRGFSPKLYSDWREMIDSEKPDIVIVNPWFNDIADCAIYALDRNINVFCEKPLAHDLEKLTELEAAIANSRGKLAGMLETRYEPTFTAAKKLIGEGMIGEIRLMDSRKSYKLGKRPDFYKSRDTYCGIIPWVAIHAIDWMMWLSGKRYTSVTAAHSSRANFGNGTMDITSAALYTMTDNVIATVTADMLRPSKATTHGDDRVRVVGTEGILEITDGALTLLSDNSGGKVVVPNEPARDIFEDFLNVIDGGESDLTAESAIEATRWALKARDYADKANLEVNV